MLHSLQQYHSIYQFSLLLQNLQLKFYKLSFTTLSTGTFNNCEVKTLFVSLSILNPFTSISHIPTNYTLHSDNIHIVLEISNFKLTLQKRHFYLYATRLSLCVLMTPMIHRLTEGSSTPSAQKSSRQQLLGGSQRCSSDTQSSPSAARTCTRPSCSCKTSPRSSPEQVWKNKEICNILNLHWQNSILEILLVQRLCG